ncbi:helix-turn-helix domain-containing protein [Variovorax sp. GB1R11]|uniref:helix-turn-helix domain-containing protein n=1 Tax=Variovorax sp. GB1R11 TaxID=3443741 RepID=UPI003F46A6FA
MNVNVVLQRIRQAMAEKDLRQIDISRELGIPQPTLSRSFSQAVTVTPTHRKICKYLEISITEDVNGAGAQALHQAVLDAWDGTERHAQALANLVRAAARASAVSSAWGKSS